MITFVPWRAIRGFYCLLTALVGLSADRAAALDTSPWVADLHSSVRLIAGSPKSDVLLGGVAFRIQAGWKTYWRTPGDSGVPPRFDFSESDNIEAVTVLWPAPMKFPDGAGGISFGYQTEVVLPLRIVVKEPGKPATLRAEINYAVCEKVCVPVEAKTEVALRGTPSDEDAWLTAALQALPQHAQIGDRNALTVQAIKRDGNLVLVDVVAPDSKEANLFIEGPTPDWALPPAKLLERTPAGVQRFSFALEGLPSGARPEGATLKLTLTNGRHAYEFNLTLN